MKKRIEIEAKFELLNVKELLKKLEELEKDNNAKLVEKDEMQKDTYFTPNDRNFLDKRPVAEWLRTREEKGKYSITYKNWAKGDGEKTRTSYLYKDIIISIDTVEKLRKFCRIRI